MHTSHCEEGGVFERVASHSAGMAGSALAATPTPKLMDGYSMLAGWWDPLLGSISCVIGKTAGNAWFLSLWQQPSRGPTLVAVARMITCDRVGRYTEAAPRSSTMNLNAHGKKRGWVHQPAISQPGRTPPPMVQSIWSAVESPPARGNALSMSRSGTGVTASGNGFCRRDG